MGIFTESKLKKSFAGTSEVKKIFWGPTQIWTKSRLPSGYQEVEYLESTGTQYIVLNEYYNHDYQIRTKFYFANAAENYVFGSWDYNNQSAFFIGSHANGSSYWVPHNGYQSIRYDLDSGMTASVGNVHEMVFSDGSNGVIIDNVTLVDKFLTANAVPTIPFVIFGRCGWTASEISKSSGLKIYYMTIKHISTDVTIHDFVPCYRISDSVAGLYDLTTDSFYTNNGTGAFNLGPEV